MKKTDFDDFTKIMIGLNELSVRSKGIGPEGIKLAFDILMGLDIEQIRANAVIALQANPGQFPTIPQLQGKFDKDNSDEAQEAYAFLEKVVISRGHQNIELIKESCESNGWEHLVPYLDQWAPEIGTTDNVIATRAQFLNQYKAIRRRKEIKLLKNESPAALPENIQKQIGEIG